MEPVEANTSQPVVQGCAGGLPKSHTASQSGSLSRASPFRLQYLSRAGKSNELDWLIAQGMQVEAVETSSRQPVPQGCAASHPSRTQTARVGRASSFRLAQSRWPIELAAWAGRPGRPYRASRSQCKPTRVVQGRTGGSPKSHPAGQSGSLSRARPFRLAQSSWPRELCRPLQQVASPKESRVPAMVIRCTGWSPRSIEPVSDARLRWRVAQVDRASQHVASRAASRPSRTQLQARKLVRSRWVISLVIVGIFLPYQPH